MAVVNRARQELLFAGLLLIGLVVQTACASEDASRSHRCVATSALDCGVAVDGGTPAQGWDLVGYACPGTDRPDQDPTMIEGVPEGLVCSNRGALVDGSGSQGYCCTPATVSCALNRAARCAFPEFGYQCRGSSRPEMLNALLSCHQGVLDGDLIDYCCASPETKVTQGCTQTSAIGCDNGLIGWSCPKGRRPTQEELGSNKSKADFYYMVCPIPMPADNVKYDNFCCYTQAPIPIGGSCVEDLAAPCAPGRFGIACYGPDTPHDDFPPLQCDPGVPGISAEGYAATVYCCDFTAG
jgi:hypothetical protein